MKLKKRANRNVKATFLFLSCICAASSSIAIDLELIYAEHAKYCMTQLNTEKQNFFKRLFNEEVTEECIRDAIKKTSKEFDTTFFENKISDEEYRRALARFEALSDERLLGGLQKEINSSIERHSIISTQDKRSGDRLPTAPGYISIGAQIPEKN
ncbi:MAG: hypothetical protein CMD66_03735 [Gammaproteobacteria bacterium]|nr:hypothetical protein [Gammaproteobacteria bacterium]|tara:strand:+ start:788 stop:1252 length:465 start_codon:yes stop_codon:yes gene_type:complete